MTAGFSKIKNRATKRIRGGKSARGIFITGTDTSVGKTSVAAGLAVHLTAKHFSVGVMKPVQTGSQPVRGSLLSGDALTLSNAAQIKVPNSLAARVICPYSFPEPVAPLLASQKHRWPIRFAPIQQGFRKLIKHYDFVIVEGAGGLLSPFSPRLNSLTLALGLDLPLLIVVENRIGALNQVLLTIEHARTSGATIAGIIFNQVKKSPTPGIEKSNPRLFKQLSRVPIWAVIPFISSQSEKKRRERVGKYLRKAGIRLNKTLKSL